MSLWLITSCGVPNLDPTECAASRTAVREFYSFHFGNDMKISAEGRKARAKFLTPELSKRAETAAEGTDPFTTGTGDMPKAFRADVCRVLSPERTEFDVLLFWKDDTRTEQRKIKVQTVKRDDQWLVDEIIR